MNIIHVPRAADIVGATCYRTNKQYIYDYNNNKYPLARRLIPSSFVLFGIHRDAHNLHAMPCHAIKIIMIIAFRQHVYMHHVVVLQKSESSSPIFERAALQNAHTNSTFGECCTFFLSSFGRLLCLQEHFEPMRTCRKWSSRCSIINKRSRGTDLLQ